MADHTGTSVDPHEHGSALKYWIVWVVLCIFTVVTFEVAQGEHHSWSLAVALGIAIFKGSLVAMIFMHLWGDRGLPKLVLLMAILLFILLISLVITDLHFRFPLVTPRGTPVTIPPREIHLHL